MNAVALILVMMGTGALLLFGAPDLVAGLPVIGGLLKFSNMPIANFRPGIVTQRFRPPSSPGARDGHNGIDFGVPIGTPLLNVAPGVVLKAEPNGAGNSGRFVIVKGRFPFSPTIAWGYAHMSRVDVAVGQELNAGDVIGLSGNTGLTQGADGELILNRSDGRGAHLHFTTLDVPRGLTSLDPASFLPESLA